MILSLSLLQITTIATFVTILVQHKYPETRMANQWERMS